MLETLESIIAKKLNFHTIDHQLKVYGYCRKCQEKMKAAGEPIGPTYHA